MACIFQWVLIKEDAFHNSPQTDWFYLKMKVPRNYRWVGFPELDKIKHLRKPSIMKSYSCEIEKLRIITDKKFNDYEIDCFWNPTSLKSWIVMLYQTPIIRAQVMSFKTNCIFQWGTTKTANYCKSLSMTVWFNHWLSNNFYDIRRSFISLQLNPLISKLQKSQVSNLRYFKSNLPLWIFHESWSSLSIWLSII